MFLGEDDYRYTSCNSTFECGYITSVEYPFWGGKRPSHCGYPDFKLECLEDGDTRIDVNSRFRVLDINQENQTLRLTRGDVSGDLCSLRPANTSFNLDKLHYAPYDVNFTLCYGCPSTNRSPLSCKLNNSDLFTSIQTAISSRLEQNTFYAACQLCIEIPILQEAIDRRRFDPLTVEDASIVLEVLRDGFDVQYDGNITYCSECKNSGGQCGYDWTSHQFNCFCTYGLELTKCSVKACFSSPTLHDCILPLFLPSCQNHGSYKQSPSKSIIFWKRSNKAQSLVEEFLKNYGSLAPKRYNYSDIKKITNSFKDKVGQGGYGFVYKGKLLDGRLVAVKLLNKAKGDGEEFINEIGSISRTSHVNVVSLLGFCFEGSKRALIYEFMPNGSLEKFIYDPNPLEAQSQLGWEMLYQITVGIARGLEYLHRGCKTRILHFDIKPHNILLDHDFTPKISDFGLAKLCPNKESVVSMLDARGTAGYIAPEVFSRNFGGVSHKSDVYSYGMMALEIVGRRKNINVQVDHTSEIYFPQWIYKRLILDEDLGLYGITSEDETTIARKMIFIALWCIQTNPVDRPSMSRVVEMLEGRNELLQIPPKPYLCSPPRSQ
ncbi:hypothetical protein AQUCO_04100057v1 [Aquilegia coerulea]|uniref:Protein kinase domain-containing protein n=1 Tax=Aquilegia coerulea TaxID=218851 RepID=A0A2G5CQ47_AQUCA|nr:hypothetical protein AQUCO_04100057v1 [Aquilegia coerulea]